MVHSTSLALACLAGSLGLGGIWTKVQSRAEVPVLAHTTATAELILNSEHVDTIMTTDSMAVEKAVDATKTRQEPSDIVVGEASDMGGFSAALWIVASLCLDVLFLALGWRGFKFCQGAGDESGILDTDSETEALDKVVKDVASVVVEDVLSEAVEGSVATKNEQVSAQLAAYLPANVEQAGLAAYLPANVEQDEALASPVAPAMPKASRRKSTGELKAWMEKQRDQCEIVENIQTLVETDAKAPTSPDHEAICADEESPIKVSRPTRRNAGELKALMEKKREECHVLEGAQEHIATDAKSTGSPLKSVAFDGDSNMAPGPRSGRSNKEVQDLMLKLKSQCVVSEGPQEIIDTDAKSGMRADLMSLDKENCCN